MSVKANWERLYKFWQELNFDAAKKFDYELRVRIGDILEFSQEDIERLQKSVSVYREFKPASDQEIQEVESKLDVNLPEDFKESLKVNAHEFIDKYAYPWLGGWNNLFNCKDIVSFTLSNRKLDFEAFSKRINLTNEYGFWNDKWIIIFDWNMDYLVVLDLSDNPQKYGQVLCLCIEDSTIAKWADSYGAWFKEAVNEVLQYGELRTETIEKVLGIGT